MILGWHASTTKTMPLVLEAVKMGIWQRERHGHHVDHALVHHSDAGSQYTAHKFVEHLSLQGISPSIGSVGDAYDNAMMESIIGLFKAEVCWAGSPFCPHTFTGLSEVEFAVLAWVSWYNTDRLYIDLGYVPPAEYEAFYYANHQQLQPAAAH